MLLFILTGSTGNRRVLGISKHLMLLFIDGQKRTFLLTLQDFKTSHVIVYPKEKDGKAWVKGDFKTSHVIVYRQAHNIIIMDIAISKHLMLLFIVRKKETIRTFFIISKHLMLLFIRNQCQNQNQNHNFKTSHVIVYQGEWNEKRKYIIFQNISCYCLSLLI